MVKGVILITFLLIAKSAICQPGYPKKIVINNDTVVAITVPQMQKINSVYLQYKECQTVQVILLEDIDSCRVMATRYDNIITGLHKEVALLDTSISIRDRHITTILQTNAQQEKRINRLKKAVTFYSTATGILIITTVLSLIL